MFQMTFVQIPEFDFVAKATKKRQEGKYSEKC